MIRFIFLFIASFFCLETYSYDISGIVVDENDECLPYSTIRAEKRYVAVLSDSIGNFCLKSDKIKPTDTITISYLGYSTMTLTANQFLQDSVNYIKLCPAASALPEVTVSHASKAKRKARKKGKKHGWSMLKTCFEGKTAGEACGYEFHAEKNKKLLLDKVGFYFCEGDNQMTKMNFRINVYDMSLVKEDPTNKFINVLTKPVLFGYRLDDDKTSGKFEYELPEPILLPDDAMVEIEFLDDLDNEIFWFKSNVVGGKTWSKYFAENLWVKTPFSTPFFIECIEMED